MRIPAVGPLVSKVWWTGNRTRIVLDTADAEAVADFLEAHQQRRARLGDIEDELDPYRLTEDERTRARSRVGL
jgi:hypothetical protein